MAEVNYCSGPEDDECDPCSGVVTSCCTGPLVAWSTINNLCKAVTT